MDLPLCFGLFLLMGAGGFQKGMWVRASSAASPDSIPRIISLAEEMGITDIYYQAVVGGYAYYKSSVLPRSQHLTRVSGPDYDPLDSLLKEAHTRGIRVHAWVNSLLIWSGEEPPESLSHILYVHPDWSVRDVLGRPVFGYSHKTWTSYGLDGLSVDPAIPEVREWLSGICAEIARNYLVDGIHLDFIRYPGTWWGLPNRDESCMFALAETEGLRWMELTRYPRLSLRERYTTWCFWRLSVEREFSVYQAVRGVSDALAELRWGRGLVSERGRVGKPRGSSPQGGADMVEVGGRGGPHGRDVLHPGYRVVLGLPELYALCEAGRGLWNRFPLAEHGGRGQVGGGGREIKTGRGNILF